ncbi:MAG TPA: HD domain-containing phosphohydrolase [Bryobacteraceae bacterium]|jgi:response regulator RpfG family c-di-GMP phosphodiesterase
MMQASNKPRVLFVDDEPQLLESIVRSLRSEHFEVFTAADGATALEMLQQRGPFAAVVADLNMPVMDGVSLLQKARKLAPDTVRVLFTGQPDLDRAIAAVNEGEIFRFVTKPCPRVLMALMVKSAVQQHQLITAERVLLQQTVGGSIKALTEILSLTNPLAFGRASRLRHSMNALISALGIPVNWHLEVAAMLSQIGSVLLSTATLERVYWGEPLNDEDKEMVSRLPDIVEEILAHIPRLEPVREILRYQNKHFDGSGSPVDSVAGTAIPWGARALKVIIDFDQMETEGSPVSLAFDTLRGRVGWYDPDIVEALAEMACSRPESDVREMPLSRLRGGMILAQDVRTSKGTLFMARGQEVTPSLLARLANLSQTMPSEEKIRVIVGGAKQSTPATPASQ